MYDQIDLVIILFCLLPFAAIARWIGMRSSTGDRLPLPPGPKPLPIIGNALEIPTVRPWKKYREWRRLFRSDVIYLHLPMQPIIILGSAWAASDLLDKRSHLYSDRPPFVVIEMLSWNFNLAMMPYGSRWRARRRAFHQHFNQNMVDKYRPEQLQEMRASLLGFLDSPKESRKIVRRFVTAVIFKVVYGLKISGLEDEYVVIAERAMVGGSIALVPGAFWAELFPILKYVPAWVPGNNAGKLAAEYKPIVEAMRNKLYDVINEATIEGRATPSVAHTMLRKIQDEHGAMNANSAAEEHEVARDVTGIAYGAGADTTTSSCESFLLAMALFPEVQKKAQTELDRVVGPNRLPNYGDYGSLIYIRAIVMETLRWMPPFPLGVPHKSIADDIYGGFFIPKGTTVITNIWAMARDPDDYPEPEWFNPDRFIGEDGQINSAVRDPTTLSFGFGRRTCPGRYFSDNTLFIFIASMLHAFNISAGEDESGNPIELSTEMNDGMLVGPRDVPCGIKPRSKEAARLVRDAALEAEI